MATDTQIRVRPARFGGFEATFTWHGELYRVFFTNAYELACELADECIDDQVIEAALDCYEQLDWADTDYPLFMPADAVCDCSPETVTSRTAIFGAFPHKTPEKPASNTDVKSSRFWDWLAAALRIGAVTAPWVLLVIGVRVAWAKAVAWGWV